MTRLSFRLNAQKILLAALLLLPLPAAAALDIQAWNTLLAEAVTNGEVDYTQWEHNQKFDALVEQIGNADTTRMNRQGQLVFFIKAYNILAAHGILDGSSPDGTDKLT